MNFDTLAFDIILGVLFISGIIAVLPFGFWTAIFSKELEDVK